MDQFVELKLKEKMYEKYTYRPGTRMCRFRANVVKRNVDI